MREALAIATEYCALIIDMMALAIIVLGSIEAFADVLRIVLRPGGAHLRREIWLRYARWLVAGLTFQLAADIIETSIAPSWEDIGRLAAIAIIRTFLNYFLERDVGEVRERQHEGQANAAG
jgi:uncharacterized membrane protein